MNKPKPISGDTNSNESVLYTRRISVPSLTLNKDDFNDLKLIIEKTGQTPAFELETEKESLAFVDTQSLGNQKWPSNIERFTFQTEYYKPRIKGYIVNPDANNRSEITLEGYDRDWVSARTDELNRFLYEHRNFHYIFHTFKYAFSQALPMIQTIYNEYALRGVSTDEVKAAVPALKKLYQNIRVAYKAQKDKSD